MTMKVVKPDVSVKEQVEQLSPTPPCRHRDSKSQTTVFLNCFAIVGISISHKLVWIVSSFASALITHGYQLW